MRKITKQAAAAFEAGRNFKSGNMEVEVTRSMDLTREIVTMYLHGNAIAKREDGALFVRSAGWETATTKERLNGLAGVSVSQTNFQWYLNGKIWENSREFTKVV